MKKFNFLSVVFLLFLSSCVKEKQSVSLDKIEKALSPTKKGKPKIANIHLIPLYSLIENDQSYKNYLFHNRYSSFINDDEYLFQYSESIKDKVYKFEDIKKEALNRIKLINKTIDRFEIKFNLPKPSFFDRIRLKMAKDNPLNYLAKLDEIYGYLPLLIPEEKAYITSRFGIRCMGFKKKAPETKKKTKFSVKKYTFSKSCKMHYGIDIKSGKTDVYASGNGKIIKSYYAKDYGNNIVIDHGNGIKTRYAHLSEMYVNTGEKVIRGEKIGTQGNSGRSTGPHLHFEITVDDKKVNPEEFIDFNEICVPRY